MAKLIIENLGFPSVLASKPVALVGVAAGQIGAIKALEHLRSVLSHVGAIVLPGPVSVAGVQNVFDEEGRCVDEAIEKNVARRRDELGRIHPGPHLSTSGAGRDDAARSGFQLDAT